MDAVLIALDDPADQALAKQHASGYRIVATLTPTKAKLPRGVRADTIIQSEGIQAHDSAADLYAAAHARALGSA